MALDALLFDLDGTLIDTNELHGRAWEDALTSFGYRVGRDRILEEIGKGGSMLVPALVGETAEREQGEALRTAHDERYLELVDGAEIRVFDRVRELLAALRERGIKTAIATASKQESLDAVTKAAGLDLDALVDAVVTDSDVEQSKPHPDVVQAACKKLGVAPTQCAMLGDTPYDVTAAARAGVVAFSVLTGVHDERTLRLAGARAVYADAADFLARIDEALELASPGPHRLDYDRLEALMDEALRVAEEAVAAGNVPIGSVVAHADGEVLGRGFNRHRETGRCIQHAEIEALFDLPHPERIDRRDLVLVTTLEPCIMCYGAAMNAGVDTILYALEAPDDGGPGRCPPVTNPGVHPPRVFGGIGRDRSLELLRQFQERHHDEPYIAELLEKTADGR